LRARILIVDDQLIVRTWIRRVLDAYSFQICGEARDGKEAIEKAIELRPDIILLDINMPVMDGIRAAHEVRLISPKTKIVFLTSHDVPVFRDAAQKLADAFISKDEAGDVLIPVLNGLAEITETDLPRTVSARKQAASEIE